MHETTSDAVLARIRQLLAKAESTTFEAEALAFTPKAHELMARHAIDLAMLDASSTSPHDGPITQTIRPQRAVTAHQWPDEVGSLLVRMGIHRGEVIRDADDFFGRTVIIGARVAASADGGEVLVTRRRPTRRRRHLLVRHEP